MMNNGKVLLDVYAVQFENGNMYCVGSKESIQDLKSFLELHKGKNSSAMAMMQRMAEHKIRACFKSANLLAKTNFGFWFNKFFKKSGLLLSENEFIDAYCLVNKEMAKKDFKLSDQEAEERIKNLKKNY